MYQLSDCCSLFFNVKAKIALPFLTASFRSASSDDKELLIKSKAAEEGNASKGPMLEYTWMNRDDEQE